jgi:prephenate dehydrogenase
MKKLLIFGVGLIGGSVALKAREQKLFSEIVGVSRAGGTDLNYLVENNMLDYVSSNTSKDISSADMILIATPVAQINSILKTIYPHLSETTIITDVGSTKLNVLNEAKLNLKDKYNQFIGSHPIAGSEKNGAKAAELDLFKNKNIIITEENLSSTDDLKKLTSFWSSLGGIVSKMTAEDHDQIFSTVSHLPHLLAFNLVNLINKKKNKEVLLNFAASGFRDFSRIAASSPEMWRDICLANKESILQDLILFEKEINELKSFLELNDEDNLEKYLKNASTTRKDWSEK